VATVGLSIGFRTTSHARMSRRRIVRGLSQLCLTNTSADSLVVSRSRQQRGPKIRISRSEMVGLFQWRWSQVSNVCAGWSFCACESSTVRTGCCCPSLSKRLATAAIPDLVCCGYRKQLLRRGVVRIDCDIVCLDMVAPCGTQVYRDLKPICC